MKIFQNIEVKWQVQSNSLLKKIGELGAESPKQYQCNNSYYIYYGWTEKLFENHPKALKPSMNMVMSELYSVNQVN